MASYECYYRACYAPFKLILLLCYYFFFSKNNNEANLSCDATQAL